MKRIIGAIILLAAACSVRAQGTFTIHGQVTNVEEGTVMNLFRIDGNVGSTIAVDTIRNGQFHFQIETLGDGTEELCLMGRSDRFPSMSLGIWARPGEQIKVTGDNTLIRTWNVESTIPEQITSQAFMNGSRELWNEYQRIYLSERLLRNQYRKKDATEDEKQAIRAKGDSLRKVEEDIKIRIDANVIKRLKQMPVEDIWLKHLERLAASAKYTDGYPHREEVIALYEGLTDTEKQTDEAMNTYTYLFPPQVVEVGDEMADADLYDLEGNMYRLADFKGKYILLDFWSRGCGPCILALPEMKEIAEEYKDSLTIVSLSIDTKEGWKKASETHQLTWKNLNELKGMNGLYARYGVRGIPNYVFISPEGKIIEKWSGYGKNSLKEKLGELLR